MKKILKVLYGLCIFVLYLLCSWAFVFAVFERILIIALLCPVAFAALVGMVVADMRCDLL